jgi:tetraacyldisaccharide 4'-kinase
LDVPAVDGPVVAFCGIARPAQFFSGLESAGLTLASRKAFPDHHRYTIADLEQLKATAAPATAFITTEKDFARLGNLVSAFSESLPLKTVRLRIEIENESAAIDWLAGKIASAQPHPPL